MQDMIFKHTLPVQLRFNDIDALGHVNNSIYFTFYDLGKTRYIEEVKRSPINWNDADLVIANINANFLLPVFMHEKIAVQTATISIGNKSLKVAQRIINIETKEIKATCETVLVGFDVKSSSAKEISDAWREAISFYEGQDFSKNSQTRPE